jgi:Peptidase propeptide and YPEB domain
MPVTVMPVTTLPRRWSSACRLLVLALVSITVANRGSAQATSTGVRMKEDRPGQLAQARVSPDSARAIARARVPRAQIAEEGIEMEHGRLLYSFDMKTRGRRGIDEVLVDALTGAVISVEHEGPAQEAAERAQDERERRAKRDSSRTP